MEIAVECPRLKFECSDVESLPWVPEVFLVCGGKFRCLPKAEAMTRGHVCDPADNLVLCEDDIFIQTMFGFFLRL